MTRIRLETLIDAPIERVFDLARDIGFHEAERVDVLAVRSDHRPAAKRE